MRPGPTQASRVLAALETAGPRGITQVDFFRPTLDGGPPITRLAARVNELRNAGHLIIGAGERQSCKVYCLESAATQLTIAGSG